MPDPEERKSRHTELFISSAPVTAWLPAILHIQQSKLPSYIIQLLNSMFMNLSGEIPCTLQCANPRVSDHP